jgi:hypothetical protein
LPTAIFRSVFPETTWRELDPGIHGYYRLYKFVIKQFQTEKSGHLHHRNKSAFYTENLNFASSFMPRAAKNITEPLENIRLPRTQIQAMRIVVDLVKTGSFFYRTGWITLQKLESFALEMHEKIGIGLTTGQKEYRRSKGISVGHLLVVRPFDDSNLQPRDKVFFCLLWSEGLGQESVFPQYFDARHPYQRLIWENKLVEKTPGKLEGQQAYVLTHCDVPSGIAHKRGGDVVMDKNGEPLAVPHRRTLTWLMTSETYKREMDEAKKRVQRLLSSSPRKADSTPLGRRCAAIKKYSEEIETWGDFLSRRPGFHGINRQRYTLFRAVRKTMQSCGVMKFMNENPELREAGAGVMKALCRPSPANPHLSLAWSALTLGHWLDGLKVNANTLAENEKALPF